MRDGADGLAILATNEPDLFMSTVFNKPPYKSGDLQTIMVDVLDPRIMLVKKDSDINSFKDFVERAKAQPGKLAVSVTQGGAQELFAKWLFSKLGLQVRIVGYEGGGPAANAMLAGDVVAAIGDDFARLNIRAQIESAVCRRHRQEPALAGSADACGSRRALWREAAVRRLPRALRRLCGADRVQDEVSRGLCQAAAGADRRRAMRRSSRHIFERNSLNDLSIGKPGEALQSTFAADFSEIPKLK